MDILFIDSLGAGHVYSVQFPLPVCFCFNLQCRTVIEASSLLFCVCVVETDAVLHQGGYKACLRNHGLWLW